ncbi:LamB/YcsF family protein [Amycolatopsis acidicola]|uniref:5-oxoprolinase subunit A n=1 Tax=Amycolatopsis acidicola TaxID=2596893 RepID=A0A5N0UU87_9PSEU|nr:LamB/YcsF family protein [Amycolatopsis acidicola]
MVDLVADLGESFGAWTMGDDAALLDLLTSANIACGFHAGDPRVMDRTVRACVERGVRIGAHPSFPDLAGFGRRAMELTEDEVRTDVLYQLGALSAFTRAHSTRISHLAPHGKLGNLVVTRRDYARAVADAVEAFDSSLVILVQEGEMAALARERGLRIAMVGIADRAYEDDGTLVSRSEPGAVLSDPDEVTRRTVRMVTEGLLTSRHGKDLPIKADCVQLHGDGPTALRLAKRIRGELEAAGVRPAPLDRVLGLPAA